MFCGGNNIGNVVLSLESLRLPAVAIRIEERHRSWVVFLWMPSPFTFMLCFCVLCVVVNSKFPFQCLTGVIWQTNCETEQQSTACHCDHCVHGFYHHHRALNEQASYCRLFYATAHTHQLATTSRGF
jgi:hypothetical protein